MISYQVDLVKQYARRIFLELLIIPLAYCLAWFVRFDGQIPATEWQRLGQHMLPIALVYIAVNLAFGIYRRLWAFASFRDAVLLAETIGLSTLMLVVVNFVLTGYRDYRLSTGGLVIGGLFILTLSTIAKYRRQLAEALFASWSRSTHSNAERVLIVGPNEAAQQLATQMYLGRRAKDYELVGFVDDDRNGRGMSINGAPILGTPDQIQALVRDREVDVIIIARRPSDREELWQLISSCQETAAKIKVLPDLFEVIEEGYEDPLALRDVAIDDLLGRPPATISDETCKRTLADKVILVTGGAGSIGSELCRQILRFKPQLLLALDNNETGLYKLDLELNQGERAPLQTVVADVTDWYKVKKVFQRYRPQIVFHAAAYKHVPLVECHPEEAVRVNIMGTVIVSEIAREYGAEQFILISTDKAVSPRSVMGASKRIGELWMKAMAERGDTVFTAVRFGNVIGSRGSVLPTFARQIELGGPVTVTDPQMYRFFISTPEAACLVLQSAGFSRGGEVFMLDMGKEVSILNLARRMIRIKGLRVGEDIEIRFTGVRPGEKLREELAYNRELKEKTPHPRIHSLRSVDESIDRDTLLGVILILSDSLRSGGGDHWVRQAIFQIATCDIDGFLTQVTGVDLTRDWRQLPANITLPTEEASLLHAGGAT
ncbi:MAG: nucleoside-diphosphate sugar epimerase/dehydratase [Anaerolineae bacterium]|jgi:FlaA1/EpsC-like NDP-sugar epimerase